MVAKICASILKNLFLCVENKEITQIWGWLNDDRNFILRKVWILYVICSFQPLSERITSCTNHLLWKTQIESENLDRLCIHIHANIYTSQLFTAYLKGEHTNKKRKKFCGNISTHLPVLDPTMVEFFLWRHVQLFLPIVLESLQWSYHAHMQIDIDRLNTINSYIYKH